LQLPQKSPTFAPSDETKQDRRASEFPKVYLKIKSGFSQG